MFPARRNVYNLEWATKLEKALHFLNMSVEDNSRSVFICTAIVNANDEGSEGLCAEIDARLHPSQTFTNWLYSQNTESYNFVTRQKLRKDWMLDMIEEFSTKTGEVHVS